MESTVGMIRNFNPTNGLRAIPTTGKQTDIIVEDHISIPPTGLGQFRHENRKAQSEQAANFNPTNGLRAIPTGCANCLEKVETVGGQPPTEDILYIV